MTIMELGALGEFVGSIAVLFTIVYLAVQVRHSRELLERNEKISLSQVFQSRVDSRRDLERLVIELADVVNKVLRSRDMTELTDVEALKMRQLISLWMDWWDNNVYQESLGLMSTDNLIPGIKEFEQILNLWGYAGMEPPVRVKEWYEKRRQQSA